MPSPDKLLQLQTVYLTSLGKSQAVEVVASPPRKRKPGPRKPGLSGLSPLPGSLSPQEWTQWMHEAQELNASASVFLATTSSESLVQAANEGLQLVLNPEVARTDERLATMIEARAIEFSSAVTTTFAMKHSPAADPTQQWRWRVTKPRKRKKTANLSIDPLLSDEMRTKLQAHLEEKIKGTIWENEIRSRLARPLSASTFCSRNEQLQHPLAAAQFTSANPSRITESAPPTTLGSLQNQRSRTPRFPFSVEAHKFANCIRRCRLKACFRVALKARTRTIAIAIRILRRRGIPLIVKGFRRRRCAAIRIQRCYRRFLRWRAEFLRPFVCKNVAAWVRQGLKLAAARVVLARLITVLYLARRARWLEAARRAAHLRRWAAKTRVSLFIHQTWTPCWFRSKRVFNVDGMKQELAALEVSDRAVSLEYTTIFATPLGQDILKKELAVWRIGVHKRSSQESAPSSLVNSTTVETNEEPAILRLRQCFQIFDLDGSGSLDLDEFQLLLSYLRGKKQKQLNRGSVSGKRSNTQQPPKLTTAQMRSLYAELDGNGDGGITRGEFESWWQREHERATLSNSASINFLSRGLDGLVLQSHGLLFWLLGRKQQLERKFVKKLMVRRAMESGKRDILYREIDRERASGLFSGVFRCSSCGRRFGLGRDLVDHINHDCNSNELVVDTFKLKRWVHQEEFRLLEDVKNGV